MNSQNKIKIGIVGGSGYAGEELVKLISSHPNADLIAVSSRDLYGKSLQSVYDEMHNLPKINFVNPDDSVFFECEVVFLATPHGFSMSVAGKFLDNGIKVIDLSADFRITNPESWKNWYESDHTALDLLKKSVYGLYFCGGGAHNKSLMKRIKKDLGFKIYTTADIGVDPDYLEATSFAWFAAQRVKGRRFDLSKVTGSNREVFLGVITEPTI